MISLTDKFFYRLGIFLFIAGIIVSFLQNFEVINFSQLLYPCMFHQITGLFCPGCGGTRAFTSLLQGHFISCFIYHPFVFYCFVMYVLFMTSHTLEKVYVFRKKVATENRAASRIALRFLLRTRRTFLTDKKKAPRKIFITRGLSFRITYVYFGIVIILLQWMVKNLFLLIS